MRPLLLGVLLFVGVTGCALTQTKPEQAEKPFEVLLTEAQKTYHNKDWARSESLYSDLIRLAPSNGDLWFRLGNIFARLNKADQAVAAYREALVRVKGNSKAWHNMAIVQLKQAANSFQRLRVHAKPGDPLTNEAREMFEAISKLLRRSSPTRGSEN